MLLAAFVAVWLFKALHLPLPWLLGPMVSTVILKLKYPAQVICSVRFRNLFLVPLGYGIGTHVTLEACQQMISQSLGMIVATLFSIVLSIAFAWWTARATGVNIASSTIGNMPGGLTPMILICENIPQADVNIVVVLQSMRLMGTIFAVPFLVLNSVGVAPDIAERTMSALSDIYALAPAWQLILVACAGAAIGYFIHMPANFLLGPIISTGIFSIYLGGQLPDAPQWLVSIAQIVTGIYLGTCIDPFQLGKSRKLLPVGIAGVVGMIAGSLATGYILSLLYGFSTTTGFLATAPGGIAEMCITGMVLGENVPVILAYQLFRMLFLCSVMPFLLQWYFTRHVSAAG